MSHLKVDIIHGGPRTLEAALNGDLAETHDLIQLEALPDHAWLVVWQESRAHGGQEPPSRVMAPTIPPPPVPKRRGLKAHQVGISLGLALTILVSGCLVSGVGAQSTQVAPFFREVNSARILAALGNLETSITETVDVNIVSINSEALSTTTSECAIISAASNNATNCKTSAGAVHGVWFINTTGTVYYFRRYNTASAPTCSSATGLVGAPIPVPADTSGSGTVITFPLPQTFDTGVSYCLTGGSATNDNTNAATGIFGGFIYR